MAETPKPEFAVELGPADADSYDFRIANVGRRTVLAGGRGARDLQQAGMPIQPKECLDLKRVPEGLRLEASSSPAPQAVAGVEGRGAPHTNPAPYRLDGKLVSLCPRESKGTNPSTLLWDELNRVWWLSFRAPNMVDDRSGWWLNGRYMFIALATFCPWCGDELAPPPEEARERDKEETAQKVATAADWLRKHGPQRGGEGDETT